MKQSTNQLWNIQADTKGRNDFDFYITNNNKYAIYFSNIDEYGMMKFVSPVQIWTDKDNPKLIFDQDEIKFEFQYAESCYYLEKSDIIILLSPCKRGGSFDLLYILFDFNKQQFAIINAPNFILNEVEKGIIRFDAHFRYTYEDHMKESIEKDNGKMLHLDNLKWHNLRELKRICSFAY